MKKFKKLTDLTITSILVYIVLMCSFDVYSQQNDSRYKDTSQNEEICQEFIFQGNAYSEYLEYQLPVTGLYTTVYKGTELIKNNEYFVMYSVTLQNKDVQFYIISSSKSFKQFEEYVDNLDKRRCFPLALSMKYILLIPIDSIGNTNIWSLTEISRSSQ